MPLENPASRQAAEHLAQLRATLGKLEVALGATHDSIAWTDARGRVEWCNAPFDRLVGRQHMAVIGKDIRAVLPIDRWAVTPREHPADAVLASRSFATETIEVKPDGRGRRFLEFFGSWAQGGGVQPIAVFVVRDVTARRQREDALERTTAMLEALNEAAFEAILIVDEGGRIARHNERFAKMWGIPEALLTPGQTDEAALKSALPLVVDPEGFLGTVQRLYCDREATGFEELSLVDGRVLERYTAPVRAADGAYRGRAWFFRDITSRKAAERALEEKTAELARSNAELQQFASAASHDLTEPLRKITAFGDLLRRRAADKLDASSLEFLDRMQSAAVRMGRLIEDLLTFSRVMGDTRPFERVDLNETAREVAGDLERRIEEAGGKLDLGPLPVVDAHPFQMRQLFQNLIANGFKFRRPDAPPEVKVYSRPGKDGFLEIVFEDNGIGFEPQYEEKIFQPFLRLHTRQEYPGTGLGLAICRRILLRHGGWIVGKGEPGRGARFVVTIPSGRAR